MKRSNEKSGYVVRDEHGMIVAVLNFNPVDAIDSLKKAVILREKQCNKLLDRLRSLNLQVIEEKSKNIELLDRIKKQKIYVEVNPRLSDRLRRRLRSIFYS